MENNTKLSSHTLSSQLAKALEDEIAKGRWTIGQKIPSEVELIKIYGVSRNTLREAVHYLSMTGVLDIRPGDGTYVRSQTVFGALLNKRLAKEDLATLMEVRMLIEPQIAAYAAERRTAEELTQLLKLEGELEQSFALQESNYIDKDIAFHTYFAQLAHNDLFRDIYCSMLQAYEPFLRQAFLPFLDSSVEGHHRALCEKIQNQQAEEAKILVSDLLAHEKQILAQAGLL